jgi:hypothetical protein
MREERGVVTMFNRLNNLTKDNQAEFFFPLALVFLGLEYAFPSAGISYFDIGGIYLGLALPCFVMVIEGTIHKFRTKMQKR